MLYRPHHQRRKNVHFSLVLVLIASIFCISCEKEINIVPHNAGNTLVVEATIENDQPPLVYLTKTFSYFSKLDSASLNNSFVRNAVITVSDGVKTVQLKEYSNQVGIATIHYYTIDSANPSQIIIGQFSKFYKLDIAVGGKHYLANTSIPSVARKIDSLWWKQAPNNKDSSLAVIFSKVTDPKGFGNYIRYFTSVNDSAYLPGLNSVFDDQVVDGTTYDIQVFRGQNRNIPVNDDTYGYFKHGEKVKIKLSNVDKATYDFWRTWEQNQSNLGNPFSTPVKVLGNISNGALGYFGGYASMEKTIEIPR